MGGNAIKNTFVRRFAKEEFEVLSAEVLYKVRSNFKEVCSNSTIVPYYKNKPSFGDMDVLVRSHVPKEEINHEKVLWLISAAFGATEIHCNDGVYSFPYREFQIDLIFTEPESYISSLTYFSYNDLGNLLGRISKSAFDIAYGHLGLYIPVRDEKGGMIDSILLSREPQAISDLLRLDHRKFEVGFDELGDVFAYVVSSPYFRKSFFNLDSLNHINRVRNRKRKSYMSFLEYVKGLPDLPDLNLAECAERVKALYPQVESERNSIVSAHAHKKLVTNAARESAKFHFGIDNATAICEAMNVFRTEFQKNPNMSPEYATQLIYKYKQYGYPA